MQHVPYETMGKLILPWSAQRNSLERMVKMTWKSSRKYLEPAVRVGVDAEWQPLVVHHFLDGRSASRGLQMRQELIGQVQQRSSSSWCLIGPKCTTWWGVFPSESRASFFAPFCRRICENNNISLSYLSCIEWTSTALLGIDAVLWWCKGAEQYLEINPMNSKAELKAKMFQSKLSNSCYHPALFLLAIPTLAAAIWPLRAATCRHEDPIGIKLSWRSTKSLAIETWTHPPCTRCILARFIYWNYALKQPRIHRMLRQTQQCARASKAYIISKYGCKTFWHLTAIDQEKKQAHEWQYRWQEGPP